MIYSDERLIQILTSVNATAIDNDGGKPGKHLAEVCRQAAERIRALDPNDLNKPFDGAILPLPPEYGESRFSYVDRPARTDELGTDEVGC
jgi:hypothetical protein